MVTREAARMIAEDISLAIEQVLLKHQVRKISQRSTYGDRLRYSIEIIPTKLPAAKTARLTQMEVDHGLAIPGTVLWIYDGNNAMCHIQATVLKVNREKYVFEFTKYPEDGQFVARFNQFKISDPDKAK